MKIVCAWCGKDLGEKPPYEEESVTHGICPECKAKYFPKKSPIIHEAITKSPDPEEFYPVEVSSAFPASAESVLSSEEKIRVDELIEGVPDENDTGAINYWMDMDDKIVYLEGWCDKCLAGTGFPDIGGGEWDQKIEHMVRDAKRTLPEKEGERGLTLIEGGFREFEAGDKGWLYGVTWGVYSKQGGNLMTKEEIDKIAKVVAERVVGKADPCCERLAALKEILLTETVEEAMAIKGKYREIALTTDDIEAIDKHINRLKSESEAIDLTKGRMVEIPLDASGRAIPPEGNPGEYWREFTELAKSDQVKIEASIRPKPYTDHLWQTDAKGSLLLNQEGRPLMSKYKDPAAYQKGLLEGNPGNPKTRLPDTAKCIKCRRVFDLPTLRERKDYEPGICPGCGGTLRSIYEKAE